MHLFVLWILQVSPSATAQLPLTPISRAQYSSDWVTAPAPTTSVSPTSIGPATVVVPAAAPAARSARLILPLAAELP
jgi:hypothetical protein